MFIERKDDYPDTDIVIRGTIDSEPVQYQVNTSTAVTMPGVLHHKFLAGEYISKLENIAKFKDKVIELGLHWGLLSKYTSYVCYADNDEPATSSMKFIGLNKLITQKIKDSRYMKPIPAGKRKIKAQAAQSTPQRSEQRHPQYILIDGQQFKISSQSHAKTGKHGYAKSHIIAINPNTGEKREIILNENEAKERITEVPLISVQNTKIEGEHVREVDRLIYLQGVKGNFLLSQTFLEISGLSEHEILEKIPTSLAGSTIGETLWITIIALQNF